ncbi:MAG: hypothetical protein LBL04_02405 [Bacteroidales bacterium]|jgi:hypothetical protein|nr:hypothetical protein [Bacteroidales bacterium]
MKNKIYSLKGLIALSLPVRVEGKEKRIYFEGGSLQGNFLRGGTFASDDEEIQKQVEQSAYFKKGIIFLKQTVDKAMDEGEKPADGNEKPAGAGANTGKSFPGVTNAQKAKEILIAEFGVKEDDLDGPNEVIVSAAKKAGAGFPDWAAFNV